LKHPCTNRNSLLLIIEIVKLQPRATKKTFKYTSKWHLQDNRLVQLLGDDKLKTLYGNAIEESDEC